MNASLLSPYLDSLAGTKFTNGANFAVVGSSTLPKFVPFSLNIQLMQFLHFKSRTLELVTSGIKLFLDFFSALFGAMNVEKKNIGHTLFTATQLSVAAKLSLYFLFLKVGCMNVTDCTLLKLVFRFTKSC